MYLNRHCFNGLCRFNQSGEFNTPFGKYERPYFPDAEMTGFAEKLKNVQLKVADFRKTFESIECGDVVYCDPPYLQIGGSGGFTEYSGASFSLNDQKDLATLAGEAAKQGATVLISNHDTPVARELYAGANRIVPLLVSRTISCDGNGRHKAREVIAVFNAKDEHTRRTRKQNGTNP